MADFLFGLVTAFWLGLLTSVLPCPMTINVAAIAYLSGSQHAPRRVAISGLLYTAGQMAAYVGVASLVSLGAMHAPRVSLFLQQHGKEMVGPVLVLLAMMLLDLLPFGLSTGVWGERLRGRVGALGLGGNFFLGAMLALSFCPASAASFFSILPVALQHGSPLAVPAAFGLGAALPVLGLAMVMAVSMDRLGAVFGRVTQIQRWARIVTGLVLLAVGVYYAVAYIFL